MADINPLNIFNIGRNVTSRRSFIASSTLLMGSMISHNAWAERLEKSRRALVIGNGAYLNAPLENPVNDARSISSLLNEAKFGVSQHIDANRSQMIQARDEFVSSLSVASPSVAIFYFAGHGVQIDWRNYLIPVDARIASQSDIIKYGFDLNHFLSLLNPLKNTTFIFILDSCRDNPFGTIYQPENKGLSQFDAPNNSLIAYSTSPGHVAEDGSGSNGLYTEKLLIELQVRGVKIEDALKRVRLNVRLASKGAQIPWESTSLEEEVYLFENAKLPNSPDAVEQQIRAELDRWFAIKNSNKSADWIAYLRDFPGGRFSEIARFHLEGLAEKGKATSSMASAVETPPIKPAGVSEEKLAKLPEQSQPAMVPVAEKNKTSLPNASGMEAPPIKPVEVTEEKQVTLPEPSQPAKVSVAEHDNTNLPVASGVGAPPIKPATQSEVAPVKLLEPDQPTKVLAAEKEKANLSIASRMEAPPIMPEKQSREAPVKILEPSHQAKVLAAENDKTDLPTAGDIDAPPMKPVMQPQETLLTLPNPSLQAQTKLAEQNSIESAFRIGAANPFSSGRYALGRKFSVNDVADYVVTDQSTGASLNPYTMLVTDVDYEEDRVWINDGYEVLDLMGNYKLAKEGQKAWQTEGGFSDIPRQLVPAELYVGQSWKAVWKQPSRHEEKDQILFSMNVRVTGREFVSVPAGRFNAFRIEASGDQDTMLRDGRKGFQTHRKQIIWVVPGINFSIKEELTLSLFFGRTYQRRELRLLKQNVF